ncbi:keratin, type I cytoskeletal 40 isoform X2 [Nannospalax galili]|uniref:Keratin 40 n=1 Tax=Nannospalax galili TaxID=1026970 RepID=A0A8C6QIR9_NANGA|nr:keratin, type I cytoskeletal 40 isoform X2 [Nannospalax galili]
MTSHSSPRCCSAEPCAANCTSDPPCPTDTTCLPGTCATSRCQTPSFISRCHLPICCVTPCHFADGCNSPGVAGSCPWCEEGAFNSNEKETMQFLNDRLANYLERVRSLEETNAELECRIREQCEPDAPLVCPDYQCYFDTIEELQQKEVNLLRDQLGDRLSVELDTAPTVDLNKVLDEMRCQYETVLANNRRDAEEWFAAQTEELNQQQLSSTEQLQGCQTEMLELKRTANTLEIELQAQQSLTESLECTAAETEAQYSTQLAQMQCLIDSVEHQLEEIRCDLERQNQEYEVLLDTKARLECEIGRYRGLLESEDSRLACNPCSTASTSSSACEPCSAYVICTVENCCA